LPESNNALLKWKETTKEKNAAMSEQPLQPATRPTPDEQITPQTASQPVPQVSPSPAATGDDLRAVLLHNDDITPYTYVIEILGDLFLLSEEIADHIAWTAHTKGTAVVVVRPRAEAEKLAMAARGRARRDGYSLTFTLEQG
jgi:ATP-dependent Clp protease adaptor protein ClpS